MKSGSVQKGTRVWFADKSEVWVSGIVMDTSNSQLTVETDNQQTVIFDEGNNLFFVNPDLLLGANDLTTLSYLHEPAVLHSLQIRYQQLSMIYTYCGIVLVAINPYQSLSIYGEWIMSAYMQHNLKDMDPHIFAVAQEAYHQVKKGHGNQSIIVSGESGAGKTVNAKYILEYFSFVSGNPTVTSKVQNKIVAINPLLEAIGNAKTIRNDNSSRFGKYIEICFSNNFEIQGAQLRTYLLEKTRVVSHSRNERNYHIFYQLLACCEEPELLHLNLGSAEQFHYTRQGNCFSISGVDDKSDFFHLQNVLLQVGFSNKQQGDMFTLLAAILHLGNILVSDACEDESSIDNQDSLEHCARLLGVSNKSLSYWICNKQIITAHETLDKPLTVLQALSSRDSLAKHLYDKFFQWVISTINQSLSSTYTVESVHQPFIGVLDIYGFELFTVNSFEQFCINYANEKLQQQFNMHVFKLEQKEYMSEGIEWSFIDYYDNQPCIDLIEGKLGILSLLNEACKIPGSSDTMFANKLYEQILKAGHSHFLKPRTSRTAFCVQHYANTVTYETKGFIAKNLDSLSPEHLYLLKTSKNELISELFVSNIQQDKSKRGTLSVGNKFKDSLTELMDKLSQSVPHYIRCIKPNDSKTPFSFNRKRVVEQLRACGIIETIQISALGFPSKCLYIEFFQRYWMLLSKQQLRRDEPITMCQYILQKCIQVNDNYRLGKSKIFFRAGQVAFMENLRSDLLNRSCVMIQRNARMWSKKRQFLKILKTVRGLQSHIRGFLTRRMTLSMIQSNAAIRIQSYYRMHLQLKLYCKIKQSTLFIQCCYRRMKACKIVKSLIRKNAAVKLQCLWRGRIGRKYVKWRKKSIVKVQCCVRQWLAKRKLKALRVEARSVCHLQSLNSGLELKVIELQHKLMEEKVKNDELLITQENLSQKCGELQKLVDNSVHQSVLRSKLGELSEELKNEQIQRNRLEEELAIAKQEHAESIKKYQQESLVYEEKLEKLNIELKQARKEKTSISSTNDWNSQSKEHDILLQRHQDLLCELSLLQTTRDSQQTTDSHEEEHGSYYNDSFSEINTNGAISIPSEIREWNESLKNGSAEVSHYQQRISTLEDEKETLLIEINCLEKVLKISNDKKGKSSLVKSLQDEIKMLTKENLEMKKSLKSVITEREDLTLTALSPISKRQGITVKRACQPKKPILGMLSWQLCDLSEIMTVIVRDSVVNSSLNSAPCIEAALLFMCLRYADHCGSERLTSQFMKNVISSIRYISDHYQDNLHILSYWLANIVSFLQYLRQYSGDSAYENKTGQIGLTSFELSEYHGLTVDEAVLIYHRIVRLLERQIKPLIVPGLLEHEAIPGLSTVHLVGWKTPNSTTVTIIDVEKLLTKILTMLIACNVGSNLISQIMKQIFYIINSVMLNCLLLRKDLCHWTSGMQMRYNLNVLEEWVREHNLVLTNEILECIQPTVQATKLLQMKKQTIEDAKAICILCSKLYTQQIQKLLCMYTPHVDFEERVSHNLIKAVAQLHVTATNQDDELMINEGYRFTVKFPFTHMKINFSNVTVPDKLKFLVKI